MDQEINSNSINSEGINLGRYFRLILLQSKIIIALTLAGFVLGITIYLTSTKTYLITSLLQIQSPQQSYDPRQSLNLDFFNASETNLDNLVKLYTSRSNILDLINTLNLNIKFVNSEDKEFLDIKTFLLKKDENNFQQTFHLEILNNSFILSDDQKNTLLEGMNGEYIENDDFEIQLNFPISSSKKLIEITYRSPAGLYNLYKNKLKIDNLASVRYFRSQEGLLQISLTTDDIFQGKSIIDTANEIFIKDSIQVETEKARASILFIDTQLSGLEEITNLRKSELKNFKQENKSLNVNLEVQSIIELISKVEQDINKVDLEISQAEINFTRDNPLYLNLKSQKEALELQKNNIEQKIRKLPVAQQEYVDLFTNLEVSELLYSELANRRLNYSLMEASSIGNIRVVDQAYVRSIVGPKITNIFTWTLITFILAIITAIFRGHFFIKISNPAELQDAGILDKIVGVIPHLETPEDLLKKDTKFTQAIETTILNIETLFSESQNIEKNKGCRKIVITGPTPENGKSFISRNIAEGLSELNHKVLLLDADLKRGIQHKFFNKESIDMDAFQNISLDQIDDLKIRNNLYLLPKIKKLENTFEHLYSDQFLNKIKEFEVFFDYIILDTAPILNVSDTGLMMLYSDLNILTTRHQVNRINEISQSKQIMDQLGRSFDGIIYNDYTRPKGYYGYYDLYGDYAYRYYAERYLYDEYYEKKVD